MNATKAKNSAHQLLDGTVAIDNMRKVIRNTISILEGAFYESTDSALSTLTDEMGASYPCQEFNVIWKVEHLRNVMQVNCFSIKEGRAGILIMGRHWNQIKLTPSLVYVQQIYHSLDVLVDGVLRDFPKAKKILDPVLEAGK